MTDNSEQFDQLPEALIRRLKRQDRQIGMLTPAADRAVLAAAREQFAGRTAAAPARRSWYYPAAAAAAVAMLALLVIRPFDQADVEALRAANDVDGSGQVDVLDVFLLARSRANDADAVSQARIDALAEQIVSLDNSGAVL